MISFDSVISVLVEKCEKHQLFNKIEKAAYIRDLFGRVRLVLKPGSNMSVGEIAEIKDSLNQEIKSELGSYFPDEIYLTSSNDENSQIAKKILEQVKPWSNATYTDTKVFEPAEKQVSRDIWFKLERRVSKESWLEASENMPPWDLKSGPPIVTFFSFKGGVGRTTSLLSFCLQASEQNKHCVLVDLDLEAPGLGSLFKVTTNRGVLDAFVDYVATNKINIEDATGVAGGLDQSDAKNITVYPAGNLNQNYLEKLSRLDFASKGIANTSEGNSVDKALREFLIKIKAKHTPDYILLDARSGLHDLSGLSLHGLSHVDVLVSRANSQSIEGLKIALQTVGSRPSEAAIVVVHSMAPRDSESPEGKAEIATFLNESYNIFNEYIYSDDAPSEDEEIAQHFPVVINFNQNLERFTSIQSVKSELTKDGYSSLFTRIVELSVSEQEDEK